jgi:hypothetical protein
LAFVGDPGQSLNMHPDERSDPTFSSAIKANHLVQMLIAFQKFQAPSKLHLLFYGNKVARLSTLCAFSPRNPLIREHESLKMPRLAGRIFLGCAVSLQSWKCSLAFNIHANSGRVGWITCNK